MGHHGTPRDTASHRWTGGRGEINCLDFALATAGSFLARARATSPRPHARHERNETISRLG
eukprot:8862276-Pyramimonas_sp.AAC.1